MSDRDHLYTLPELSRAAAAALAKDYEGPSNGQVSALPSERTIRYYTTLGILDRPAAHDGRIALYGRRHLQQIVAIKRLQARGHSLVEVQRQLGGLDDEALAELAKVEPTSIPKATRAEVREGFWRDQPAAAASPEPLAESAPVAAEPSARTVHHIDLAPGVELVVAGANPPTAAALADVRAAAADLLAALQRHRLPH